MLCLEVLRTVLHSDDRCVPHHAKAKYAGVLPTNTHQYAEIWPYDFLYPRLLLVDCLFLCNNPPSFGGLRGVCVNQVF